METIDDDCSKRDISFVKTAEQEAVEAYGITKLPALVFFKQDIPNLYEGKIFLVVIKDTSVQAALVIRGHAIRGFDYSRTKNRGKARITRKTTT
jgi:hypothetical protein